MPGAGRAHARLSLRLLGGLAAGAAAAIAVTMAAEALTHALWTLPEPGLAQVTAADRPLAGLPLVARLLVVAGWCLATLAGGGIAARIVGYRWAAWPIAVLVVAGVAETVAGFTHPGWMTLLGLALPWPCAWAAGRLAARA